MAKLDFPDRDQSPWTNPDTGITYVWKGGPQGAWHIASAGDTDIFVAKTGDKMTGDLTLGPEGDTNITLNATDGSATFAGNVTVEKTGGPKTLFSSNSGRVFVGFDDDDAETSGVILDPSDVSIFNNDVALKNIKGEGDAAGLKLFDVGVIHAARTAGTDNVFAGYTVGSNVATTTIKADGSASFAGVINSTSYNTAGGNPSYQLVPTGLFQVTGTVDEPAIRVFQQGAGNTNVKAVINTDGSAEFAKVEVLGVEVPDDQTNFTAANYQSSGPRLSSFSVWGDGTVRGYGPSSNSSDNFRLNCIDGSATFVGNIVTGGHLTTPTLYADTRLFSGPVNDAVKRAVYLSEAGAQMKRGGFYDEPLLLPFGTSGATGRNLEVFGGLQINTEPDNDDNYTVTTDVDEEGNTVETRVYNGPTLDVKERLQNLIARLDSLEAEELADDATSTLLLTTVNNLNADMTKTKAALTAIRTAANAAGTLEQLKADIATATADI